MPLSFKTVILVTGLIVLCSQSYSGMVTKTMAETHESITLPSPYMTFQSAPGSEIATGYCLICHSAEYVYMQAPLSQTTWNEIVKKMKHTFGCPIPDEHIPTLVQYLVSQNFIQPSPKVQTSKEQPAQRKKNNGNPKNGKILFQTYCTNCHGMEGKGNGPIGQSLTPPAADLTATGKQSDTQLLQIIQKGRPGTAMPSWKGDLSDAEIYAVEDRAPRVYPWVNEPGDGTMGGWKSSRRLTVFIGYSITSCGFASTAAGS